MDAVETDLISGLCEDCPPLEYPTNQTRCLACPQRANDDPIKKLAELLLGADPVPKPIITTTGNLPTVFATAQLAVDLDAALQRIAELETENKRLQAKLAATGKHTYREIGEKFGIVELYAYQIATGRRRKLKAAVKKAVKKAVKT